MFGIKLIFNQLILIIVTKANLKPILQKKALLKSKNSKQHTQKYHCFV